MKTRTYSGWVRLFDDGEGQDIVTLSCLDKVALADDLAWINGLCVSVRYWIADKEDTFETITEMSQRILMGDATAEYCARYSEITGYLWTDENLIIGGHDLIEELRSSVGKYLILIIEYD